MNVTEEQKEEIKQQLDVLFKEMIKSLNLVLKEVDEYGKPIETNDIRLSGEIATLIELYSKKNQVIKELEEYRERKKDALYNYILGNYKFKV